MNTQLLDNPVRIARIRAGLSRAELARQLQVHRSTLIAMEDGRTVEPSAANLTALRRILNAPSLAQDLLAWHEHRVASVRAHLPMTARVALARNPDELQPTYGSFKAWREQFSPSAMGFARLLGISHANILQYERGAIARGMPEPMQHAMLERLEVSVPYMTALMALPATDES